MKTAVSNRLWPKENDELMYRFLSQQKLDIEISPSRTLKTSYADASGANPARETVVDWGGFVKSYFGIGIASMPAVLPKNGGSMFSSSVSRRFLINQIREIITLAGDIGCRNVSFGCPESREVPDGMDMMEAGKTAIDFFTRISAKAAEKTVLSIEPVYASGDGFFLNDSEQVLSFVKCLDSNYIRAGIDLGKVMENGEKIEDILTPDNIPYINYIRISEPGMRPLQKRDIHTKTAEILKKNGYSGCICVDMNEYADIRHIMGLLAYIRQVFAE